MIILPASGSTGQAYPNWPISVVVPTGIQAGDLVLLTFTSGTVLTGVTGPSGWSQTSLGNVSNSTIFTQAWWHIATGSEPTTWTWNATSNTVPAQAVCTLYRGVNNSTPFDTSWTTVTGTGTPETAPAITTVTANTLVVSSLVSVNNITWSPPSTSPATVLYISMSGGNDVFTQSPLAAGTLAARTFTPSGTSGRWIGTSIALRPASGVSHTGLSGSGSVSVTAPAAVVVAVSGLGSNNGRGTGNPPKYYNIGNIAWGTANGPMRNYFLQHDSELVPAPINDATVIYYKFGSGLTASITELSAP